MSLQSPLSVGDIILLGTIAYRIASALSSGSKSAPTEFAEVQSLLFSLKESFSLLAQTLTDRDSSDEDDFESSNPRDLRLERQPEIVNILNSCRDVLLHLEKLVEKYSVLDATSDGQEPRTRRLREDLKKGWKKVAWTKEGGDIAKLKQTLIAHTNALHLTITIIKGSQQTEIKGQVEKIHGKLDEIYEWFLANLKRPEVKSNTPASAPEDTEQPDSLNPLTGNDAAFSLYRQKKPGDSVRDTTPICPRVNFNLALFGDEISGGLPTLSFFCCLCRSSGREGKRDLGERDLDNHTGKLNFTLLPHSLLVRIISQSCHSDWQIYVASPLHNSPVSLILSPILPACISEIEKTAQRLGALQAARHFTNNLNTALVRRSPDEISVLSSRALVLHLAAKLLSVRFVANGVRLAVEQVESLQILQYASAALPAVSSENAILAENFGSIRFSSQQFCQIEILCRPRFLGTQGRVQKERYTLHITYNSTVSISRGVRYATICKVVCFHEKEPETHARAIKCEEVEFEFSDRSAAEEFRGKISEAKKAMLVQYLQNIRQGDLVVYERAVGDIVIGHLVLSNAQLKVVRELSTGKHRLMLVRGDRTASACFELAETFLDTLAEDTRPQTRTYDAQLVSIREDGVSIVEQSIEIDLLLPSEKDRALNSIENHLVLRFKN